MIARRLALMVREWQRILRDKGYRLTPQRQLVLEAVRTLGHATPEEILAAVRRTADGVNASTVYRTLELLGELGLVTHAHLGHGPPTYHYAEQDEHLHLVCRDCGAVVETDTDMVGGLAERLDKEHGFEMDARHFAIFGRCRECRTARARSGAVERSA